MAEILDREMTTVDDVYEQLLKRKDGAVKQSIENYYIVLTKDPMLKGKIRRNEMTGRNDICGDLLWKRSAGISIDDDDIDNLCLYMESTYGLMNEKYMLKAINIVAGKNGYHPIKDYLENLTWDGRTRIGKFLPKYVGADECQYTYEATKLLLMALISRIYTPGIKFDLMVCLVGGQGIGKSTLFRLLAIKDEWFTDDVRRLDDDNVFRKLYGHWIVEMSEMIATVNAKSIEEIKSFLSRQKETYKTPYDRFPKDRLRQCVFVGTTNNIDFLPMDRTGNRRFAPILTHADRIEKHILEDEKESREYIDQLWAEAMQIYRSGEYSLKFSQNVEEYLTELQESFMPEDTDVGLIRAWLDETDEPYVCSLMILREALGKEGEPKYYETKEINRIMNDNIKGWKHSDKKTHRFKEYGTQKYWYRDNGHDDEDGFVESGQIELPFK